MALFNNKKRKEQQKKTAEFIENILKQIENQQKQIDFVYEVLNKEGMIKFYANKQEYIEKHKDQIAQGNC